MALVRGNDEFASRLLRDLWELTLSLEKQE